MPRKPKKEVRIIKSAKEENLKFLNKLSKKLADKEAEAKATAAQILESGTQGSYGIMVAVHCENNAPDTLSPDLREAIQTFCTALSKHKWASRIQTLGINLNLF